jgi:muconate cycloisomerase
LLPEAATDQVLAVIKTMGMSQVKVKAGRPDDLSRLRRVRQTLGPEADLRLDVNGAWTVDQALTSIPELAEVGLSSVEQPVAKEDFAGLARLRQGTGVRIVADESCCTADHARELIDLQAVDGLNLKLSKCGGFSRTLDIMALADRAGVFCQLGCQVGELGILSAAGRHLASARPDLAHREGCLTRFFLGRDLIAEDLSPGPGGWVPAPQGPGLGVQVLEERIAPDLLFSLKA